MESISIAQSNKASLYIDLSVYPLIAVEKTAYEFSNRASCIIRRTAENMVTVELDLSLSSSDANQLERDFISRVADFSIQSKIDSETRVVRDALVSAALSEALRK